MNSKKTMIVCAAAAALSLAGVSTASAAQTWNGAPGRDTTSSDYTVISSNEFSTDISGNQKTYFYTDAFDGKPLSSLDSITWDLAGDHVGHGPSFNFWVTDGTHYAMFGMVTDQTDMTGSYDVNGANIQTGLYPVIDDAGAYNPYPTASDPKPLDWLLPTDATAYSNRDSGARYWKAPRWTDTANGHTAGDVLTFADIAAAHPNLTFGVPSDYTDIGTSGWAAAAPNAQTPGAINLVFQYMDGFGHIQNVEAHAVPEPSSLAIFVGLGGLALLSRRTRRRKIA